MKKFIMGFVSASILFCGISFAEEIKTNVMDCNITINGSVKTIDNPVLNYNGRAYVPLRAFSYLCDVNTDWDADNKTIKLEHITKVETKEIIKEVPVEKIVIKEVPIEVIKEVIKEDTGRVDKIKKNNKVLSFLLALESSSDYYLTTGNQVMLGGLLSKMDNKLSLLNQINSDTEKAITNCGDNIDTFETILNNKAINVEDANIISKSIKAHLDSLLMYRESEKDLMQYFTTKNVYYFDEHVRKTQNAIRDISQGNLIIKTQINKIINDTNLM